MKPREIFKAQIEHRETGTVPYDFRCEGEIELQLDDYYGSTAWRDSIQTFRKSADVVDTMKRVPTERAEHMKDPYGSIWRVDCRPFHLEQPGMLEPSFADYRWPAPEEFFANAEEIETAQQLCKRECGESFIISSLGWGLFESSWGLRGFENALMDIAAEPEFYEEMMERLTNQFLAYIDFTCEKLPETDAIMFGDDWADQRGIMCGPEIWRKLFKPRVKRIYDRAHKHGKSVITHCCGSVVDIIPDLIEIGLDVLESVQPEARGMNPYKLKADFGNDLTFWGGLGSQSTIPFGTPDEIRTEVAKLKNEMGKGGGYILAPAKTLLSGTPVANAAAVVESFVNND